METWRAGLVMILWTPITFYVFQRYSTARAAMICFLGGAMFLPEIAVIKFPMFPEIGKGRLAVLALFLAVAFLGRRRGRVEPWWFVFVLASLCGSVGTWLSNTDPVPQGYGQMAGHTFTDAMYFFLSTLTTSLLASYLGMACFRDRKDLKDCLTVFAGAGLLYTSLLLIEMRLSPQLHRWVYGYAAFEDFQQSIRYGGYRPLAFMAHGLLTSLFMLGPATAAVVAARLQLRVWKVSGRAAAWIVVIVLIMCRSTGVWVYALISLPFVRWLSPKAMTRLAVVMALLTFIYPWLRVTDRIPLEDILGYAAQIDEDRRASLEFRFLNEEVLLERALERPLFGWGSNGRNRLYDEVGNDISTTDGGWILALGTRGIFGFVFGFGLPLVSVLTVARRTKKIRDRDDAAIVAALNLYLAVFWFDMIPNAPPILLPQFVGGALCSISYHLSRPRTRSRRAAKRPVETGRPVASAAEAPEPAPA